MKYLLDLYVKSLEWLDAHERSVTWFTLGAMTVLITVMILNAAWIAAAVFAGLTYLNFKINSK